MSTRKRYLASALTLALAAVLPSSAAAAEIVDGRPGRYELESITIDATIGECKATYETPEQSNLWVRGTDVTIRLLVNRNRAFVMCRFYDMSATIEANAEVGYTQACTLTTDAGVWSDGWGRVTSAANISERSLGGNSNIMCWFDADSAPEGMEVTAPGLSRPAQGAAADAPRGPRANAAGKDQAATAKGQAAAAEGRAAAAGSPKTDVAVKAVGRTTHGPRAVGKQGDHEATPAGKGGREDRGGKGRGR